MVNVFMGGLRAAAQMFYSLNGASLGCEGGDLAARKVDVVCGSRFVSRLNRAMLTGVSSHCHRRKKESHPISSSPVGDIHALFCGIVTRE